MKKLNKATSLHRVFGRSAAVTIGSAAALCGIIVCVIAAAPKDSGSIDKVPISEPTHISAPVEMIDTYLWGISDVDSNDIKGTSYMSPETVSDISAPATESDTAPDTKAVKSDTPDTGEPETTAAPETTTAKVTEPVTTAPPPETTTAPPETTAPPAATTAPSAETSSDTELLLADKLEITYTTEKPKYTASERDIKLAAAIIQFEVLGSGSSLYAFDDTSDKYWEMLAVAQCIRNRVDSQYFPDTIEDVIFQSSKVNGRIVYQFSPARTDIEDMEPTEEALVAAREVMRDGVTVLADNYFYFCSNYVVEAFEKNNSFCLEKKSNGTYCKVKGESSTFYAGFKND